MGHIPLLNELVTIAGLGVLVILILSRLQLPAVAGLLAAGALAGPAGLRLVTSSSAIQVLAELGVVLLLFTIGLEFSLSRLRSIFKQVAVGGLLQVGLTVAAVVGVAVALGLSPARGLFFGFVFALSSTAIVLRALTERRELDAPHGRFIVGALIFQDLMVVPMVLVVPLLHRGDGLQGAATEIGLALLKAAGMVVVTIALSRLIVPRLLGWVDRARSKEAFSLAVLGLCMGTAWLTAWAGLSLALGAFLGGMVVAGTEYGHRAAGDVGPLRDVFVAIFFVSLGMLFDVSVVAAQPLLVGGLALAFVFGKGFLATLAALVMRFPARVAWLAGVGLAQFGEFGFVLAQLGLQSGVTDAQEIQPLLMAGIVSMFLTPLLVRAAPHISAGERLLAPLSKLLGARTIVEANEARDEVPEGHVVIVGFGVAGRLLAQALAACGQRYLVLELNADTVRAARAKGQAVYYGDATSEEALGHAHLAQARAMVLMMNDPVGARRVVANAKRVAPHVPVLLRAHYLNEKDELLALGATDVVAEEVEGAVEILVRALRWLELPRNVIEQQVRQARVATQSSDRRLTMPRRTLGELQAVSDLKLEQVQVEAGSAGAQQSLLQLALRSTTGALVVAIRRGATLLEQPDPAVPLEVGDVLFLAGRSEAVRVASQLFSAAPTAEE